MYIKKINVYMKDLDLVRPYTIAFKRISSVENGIVEIEADNGMRGYGSFNPSFEVVGETVRDALRVLNEENLSFLIRRDIRELNLICFEIQQKFKVSPGARAGLEIALYDLFCQFLGIPLVSFLGKKIDSMPTSVTIGIKNAEETLREAKEYIDRRFRILKVKTGESAEEDAERLKKLREFAGSDITIITDANQGYSCSDLKLFLEKTEGLNISLIEQPLSVGEEACLRQMPDNVKERLVADETLITPADAMRLDREKEAFGNYNIKLMKCGGISEALKIACVAGVNATGLMWGCNDESIISITAALHTAFACSNTRYIDLDGSLDLINDVVKGGFILKDGIMSVSEKPGLGVTLL